MTLHADDLYRFYRAGAEETRALRGVSLKIHPGELVALSGPSGSGKSTLMSCLAGTDQPSGGTVWIEGERMSGRSEAARAGLRAKHIGMMAQSDNLVPHLNLRDNVRFAQRIAGSRSGDIDVLLTDLGIASRAHAWPHQLSGGELARAALAVALINQPAVVLADEPTGELDEATEARLLAVVRGCAEGGCAVLVASHSPAVREVADRVLQLEDGRLVG